MNFNLNKFENLLRGFIDEKLNKEKKKILPPNYFESSKINLKEFKREYKDINLYYNQENKAFVQLNNKEKPTEKISLSFGNVLNYFEVQKQEIDHNQLENFLENFNDLPTINQQLLDDIFPPNKPTLYALSTKGTKLNISGLLNFFITHGQENKIWLEKKDRLKKDYRVSVIIDSSKSCFNKDSFYYSFSIVKSLLNIISSSMIPYFDLIVATKDNPIVLCSGLESNILNNKSTLLTSLISLLYENEEKNNKNCNLFDAIYLAIKIKIQQNSKKYFCFVLTDGIFDKNLRVELKNICSFCDSIQMNIFGIGLGLYPEGITDIFSKCL